MKNYFKIIAVVVAVAVVLYGFLVLDIGRRPKVEDFVTCVAANNPVMESYPRQCADQKTGITYVEHIETPITSDMIRVDIDSTTAIASTTVTLTGEARGGWYFEASFPVSILAPDGTLLGQGVAQAEGDWMTTEFVPFVATVKFDPKGNTEGVVRFSKDNPSGLPENDANIEVPVKFSLED